MARIILPLTELEIRKSKSKNKQYKLYDGQGLIMIVFPNGIKRWQVNYTFNKKRNSVSIGKYPEVSLKEAREKREEVNKQVSNNINPSKQKNKITTIKNFREITTDYFKKREDLSNDYIKDSISKLEKDIFPYFENDKIDNIKPLDMLSAIIRIDKRGSNVSARKTFGIVSRIYAYACTVGLVKRNIMNDFDKNIALRRVEKKNFSHTTDIEELKRVLFAIKDYPGDYNTKMALVILPYIFVRPSNIRFMKWDDVDLENKIWTISAKEMKTKKTHIVPLSQTVINILNEMKNTSYEVSQFVFPSRRSNEKCLSENTLNFGLKRMGFEITAHGFRHTASTLLHENISEHGFNSDVIEIQLAHTVGSSVHQVYNKAQYLKERIGLMNWWSDFLDNL